MRLLPVTWAYPSAYHSNPFVLWDNKRNMPPWVHFNRLVSLLPEGTDKYTNQFLNLSPFVSITLTALILIIGYLAASAFYNLFLSPLRHIPGPKLWAISYIPNSYKHVSGYGHKTMQDLHAKFGPLVRLAPNIIALNDVSLWKDVINKRGPNREMMHEKDPVFFAPNANGILGASGAAHARLRRILGVEFSPAAAETQQPLINKHIDLLFNRIREVSRNGSNPVDLNKWYSCKSSPPVLIQYASSCSFSPFPKIAMAFVELGLT